MQPDHGRNRGDGESTWGSRRRRWNGLRGRMRRGEAMSEPIRRSVLGHRRCYARWRRLCAPVRARPFHRILPIQRRLLSRLRRPASSTSCTSSAGS